MRFIGDVHGKLTRYAGICKDAPGHSVQVGDMGLVNMGGVLKEQSLSMPAHHRFIRGNHDNPLECRENPNWIDDGTVEGDVMYVGGAESPHFWRGRVPGFNFWGNEELSVEEFEKVITAYEEIRPRVMVTHDAPSDCCTNMFQFPTKYGDFRPTRTNMALQEMFEAHQPEYWIFGHWHEDHDKRIEGTRFICLAELSFIDLDV